MISYFLFPPNNSQISTKNKNLEIHIIFAQCRHGLETLGNVTILQSLEVTTQPGDALRRASPQTHARAAGTRRRRAT